MANVNAPFGFRAVNKLVGSPYNAAPRIYSTASGDGTAIFIGDPVKLAGTGQIISGRTYTDVTAASTGNIVVGICVGAVPDPTDLTSTYRKASTARLIYVIDDPMALFEIQEGTGGTAFTANDIGLNANFHSGSGSTTTGLSAYYVDNATEATTNTLDVQIIGLRPAENNAVGDSAVWQVRLNNHQYSNQVAGVA